MAKSKLVKVNEKIAEGVTEGFKKIENGVVGSYKKIEKGVVGSFGKVADKFVDQFLTKEGETLEAAKKRLALEQIAREDSAKAEMEKLTAKIEESIEASKKAGRNN